VGAGTVSEFAQTIHNADAARARMRRDGNGADHVNLDIERPDSSGALEETPPERRYRSLLAVFLRL